MEGLKAEGPVLPQEPQLQQMLDIADELNWASVPKTGGELVLVLTDLSGHLTWPCPPADPTSPIPRPTAAVFHFEVSCHCS